MRLGAREAPCLHGHQQLDGPPDQPLVGRLERAELLGEVPPGRVGAVLPRDGLERAAVIGPALPPDRIGGQIWTIAPM